jgi:mannosyl-oligosaccharide alpha-1,2-mannosidase
MKYLSVLSLMLLFSPQILATRSKIVPIGQGKTSAGAMESPHAFMATTADYMILPRATATALTNASSTSNTTTSSPTATSNTTLPACKSVQYAFPSGTGGNATRAAAVKEAYEYGFNAYM